MFFSSCTPLHHYFHNFEIPIVKSSSFYNSDFSPALFQPSRDEKTPAYAKTGLISIDGEILDNMTN